MALNIGDKAPEFSLPSKTADGVQQVVLSNAFGRKTTFILFFPRAFTEV